MESIPKLKVRSMKVDEAARVGQLVRALQSYQNMKCIPRLPTDDDMKREIVHENEPGSWLPNKYGTYTAVAIDNSKLNEPDNAHVVGYLIYSQSFSIIHGRLFWINSFFIQEEYRRHGLGKKFMEYVRLHATSTGNKWIEVPFMNDNRIGQKFYKQYGAFLVNDEQQLMGIQLDN